MPCSAGSELGWFTSFFLSALSHFSSNSHLSAAHFQIAPFECIGILSASNSSSISLSKTGTPRPSTSSVARESAASPITKPPCLSLMLPPLKLLPRPFLRLSQAFCLFIFRAYYLCLSSLYLRVFPLIISGLFLERKELPCFTSRGLHGTFLCFLQDAFFTLSLYLLLLPYIKAVDESGSLYWCCGPDSNCKV